MLTALESAITVNDAIAVQQAIFDLSPVGSGVESVDDEIAFEIIAILRRPEMKTSALSGHILNFFEFEAPRISQRAKDRCAMFLREWGNEFAHVHSVQVVAELREGAYLTEAPPKEPRKKKRHAA